MSVVIRPKLRQVDSGSLPPRYNPRVILRRGAAQIDFRRLPSEATSIWRQHNNVWQHAVSSRVKINAQRIFLTPPLLPT